MCHLTIEINRGGELLMEPNFRVQNQVSETLGCKIQSIQNFKSIICNLSFWKSVRHLCASKILFGLYQMSKANLVFNQLFNGYFYYPKFISTMQTSAGDNKKDMIYQYLKVKVWHLLLLRSLGPF